MLASSDRALLPSLRLAALVSASLLGACSGDAVPEGVVARAGGYRLTVDQVVDLLVDEEDLPTQAGVVRSLADLWTDYTLLAAAAAEDTTFPDLDVAPLVQQVVEQDMIARLRDSVIRVDTALTQDELRALFAAEPASQEMRARHILLGYPPQATPTQRDSVRRTLQDLRGRIASGAIGFEAAARSFSQDRGSAANGGDLGFFGPGDMVQPFELAVLALEPGELSEVVETPMGLHLIRLEERRTPDFDEIAPAFRQDVIAQRNITAESTYVAGLQERAGPVVSEGALGVARELARNPTTRLSGGARTRALVEWSGGRYTAGQLLELLQSEELGLRERVANGSDEDLRVLLLGRARRALLVQEARAAGLDVPRPRVDSLMLDARAQLLEAARVLGLLDLDRAPGEALDVAVTRAVQRALERNLSGATPVVPLGLVAFQLREGVPTVVYDRGVGEALLEIGTIRASRGLSPLEESATPPGAAPDSAAP